MGLVLVQTTVGTALELLRLPAALLAYLRRFVGPRLNEAERQQDFLFLKPLSNPVSPFVVCVSSCVCFFWRAAVWFQAVLFVRRMARLARAPAPVKGGGLK